MDRPSLYLILDANILAGYYAPQTFNMSSIPAAERIKNIIDSVRNGCSPHIKLLTPEICVAEVQTVLSKHANPKWSGKGKWGNPQAIHGKSYHKMVQKMRDDLHGGNLIESIPLQRYHVLAKHLITPIDHNLKLPSKKGEYFTKELGGTDQLICGMAIWFTRLLGQNQVYVITSDYRLAKVLEKALKTKDRQFKQLGIVEMAEERIGFSFRKEIYPHVLYLPKVSEKQLRQVFGSWLLPIRKKMPRKLERKINEGDIKLLLDLYKNMGIGRDKLPYSDYLRMLTTQFNDATGHNVDEKDVWKHLVNRLKKGGGKVNK